MHSSAPRPSRGDRDATQALSAAVQRRPGRGVDAAAGARRQIAASRQFEKQKLCFLFCLVVRCLVFWGVGVRASEIWSCGITMDVVQTSETNGLGESMTMAGG